MMNIGSQMSWRTVYRIIAGHVIGSYLIFVISFLANPARPDRSVAFWGAFLVAPVVVPVLLGVTTVYGVTHAAYDDRFYGVLLWSCYLGSSTITYLLVGRKRRGQTHRVKNGYCGWCRHNLRASLAKCPECGQPRTDYLKFEE